MLIRRRFFYGGIASFSIVRNSGRKYLTKKSSKYEVVWVMEARNS